MQDILAVAYSMLGSVYFSSDLNIKLYNSKELCGFGENWKPLAMNDNIVEILKVNRFEMNSNCHFVVANEKNALMNVRLCRTVRFPSGLSDKEVMKNMVFNRLPMEICNETTTTEELQAGRRDTIYNSNDIFADLENMHLIDDTSGFNVTNSPFLPMISSYLRNPDECGSSNSNYESQSSFDPVMSLSADTSNRGVSLSSKRDGVQDICQETVILIQFQTVITNSEYVDGLVYYPFSNQIMDLLKGISDVSQFSPPDSPARGSMERISSVNEPSTSFTEYASSRGSYRDRLTSAMSSTNDADEVHKFSFASSSAGSFPSSIRLSRGLSAELSNSSKGSVFSANCSSNQCSIIGPSSLLVPTNCNHFSASPNVSPKLGKDRLPTLSPPNRSTSCPVVHEEVVPRNAFVASHGEPIGAWMSSDDGNLNTRTSELVRGGRRSSWGKMVAKKLKSLKPKLTSGKTKCYKTNIGNSGTGETVTERKVIQKPFENILKNNSTGSTKSDGWECSLEPVTPSNAKLTSASSFSTENGSAKSKHVPTNSDHILYESDDDLDYVPVVKNLDTGEEIHADVYLNQPSAKIPSIVTSKRASNNLNQWSPISGRYRKVGVIDDAMERDQGVVMWKGKAVSDGNSMGSTCSSHLEQSSATIPPDFL